MTAFRTLSAPDPGKTIPVMCAPPAVITMIQACVIRRTAYELHIPYKNEGDMKNMRAILAAALLTGLPVAAYSQGTPGPADAFLYIIWPPDGATVKGAFWCRFGLRNMGVTQAGSSAPNSGHHHLL